MSGTERLRKRAGRPSRKLTPEEQAERDARRRELGRRRSRVYRAKRRKERIADGVDQLVERGDLAAWNDRDPASVVAALLGGAGFGGSPKPNTANDVEAHPAPMFRCLCVRWLCAQTSPNSLRGCRTGRARASVIGGLINVLKASIGREAHAALRRLAAR
jgi:hypothetical protein